ncbi:hypothetical protein [Clostridium manihotivorum]|uniref:Uncharacterized protein n=1 Tax=Clostridium manihotivorum TaxID=2320868 RepID=A0A410DUA5_9CLOT|nr:hypothetical protein [Clostridium manihotivorum]QAA32704.1 hypothetical protein C1I91_14265 [Clostridium manihotivorum]
MSTDSYYGYVTFADILGWKGIWQTKRETNPVDSLLQIRAEMKEYISVLQARYYKNIVEHELRGFFSDENRKDLSKEIIKISSNLETLIAKYSNNYESVLDELKKFRLELSIELISDTFVITSSGSEIHYETMLHSLISQNLINTCLKKGFLIRGATSYGEYYKQELVFVGPAIDDSASWHEMGEEIGIFFTPKANITIENTKVEMDSVILNDRKLNEILFIDNPKLKVQTFKTYMVNWANGESYFNDIIANYSTILPDIHKKILFSKDRLVSLKEKNA